jgi:hypothetical protein
MRILAATVAATLLALTASSAAFAGWSAPQSLTVPGEAVSEVAVDGHGDAALAWATRHNTSTGAIFRTSVHVTVRTAYGRVITRTVWSSKDARTDDISLVIGTGGVTIAWESATRAEEEAGAPTVRAAYGPLAGRWNPAHAIGRSSVPADYPPVRWVPHLAIAPDGDVLLVWSHWDGRYGKGEEEHGDAVAWRTPGRPFGAPRVLPDAPGGANARFDAGGTAYLYGYCSSSVLSAPAQTHRFVRAAVPTSGSILGFSLSLAGAGRGLASWISGECSFDAAAGNTPGRVYASILSAGRFSKPVAVSPPGSAIYQSTVVAVPGGGTISWELVGDAGAEAVSVQVGAGGQPGATHLITDEKVVVAADGGGDEVLGWPLGWPIYLPSLPHPGPVVRPAGGASDQSASGYEGKVAVAAPTGRAVASAWNTSPNFARPSSTIELSVWRP